MRSFKYPAALLGIPIIALCSLLVGCGVTAPGGVDKGETSTPGTTVVITGTQGTVQALPSTTASPASTAAPGAVRLLLDNTSYAAGSSAIVTIENGLDVTIAVSNHHTSCTYVQLEQLRGGAWQPVGVCNGLSPVVLAELAPGSATPQRIHIPSGPAATGTYRVGLTYGSSTAYSSTFTVG